MGTARTPTLLRLVKPVGATLGSTNITPGLFYLTVLQAAAP
jgi:hypothetical protein